MQPLLQPRLAALDLPRVRPPEPRFTTNANNLKGLCTAGESTNHERVSEFPRSQSPSRQAQSRELAK
jgi:hypothetical protein